MFLHSLQICKMLQHFQLLSMRHLILQNCEYLLYCTQYATFCTIDASKYLILIHIWYIMQNYDFTFSLMRQGARACANDCCVFFSVYYTYVCHVEFILEHSPSVSVCPRLFPSVLCPSILFFPTILSFSVPFCRIRVRTMFPSCPSYPFSLPH